MAKVIINVPSGKRIIFKPKADAKPARTEVFNDQAFTDTLLKAQSDMGEGVSIVEAETQKFLYVNEALCRLYGYSATELLELSSFLDLLAPEELPALQKQLALRTAGGRPPDHYETVIVHKSGRRIPIEVSVKHLETGGQKRLVSIIRDISERKALERQAHEAEQKLAQSLQEQAESARNRLAAIVDSSQDAIISKDLSGIIKSWNKSAERLFGYSAEEAIGKPVTILLPKDRVNEEPKIMARIRKGETVAPYETVRKRKDGTFVQVLLTVSPIKNDAGKIVGASKLVRDITHQKEIEGDLKFLANATQVLSSSLDYRTTLTNLAKIVVPYFADWCSIDMLDKNGDLQRLVVHHADPKMIALAHEYQNKYPAPKDYSQGSYKVVQTGKPEMMVDIPESLIRSAISDPKQLALILKLQIKSYITAPLIIGGKVEGVITFVMAESPRRYNDYDLSFAMEIARRASISIDNAKAHTELEERVRERTASLRAMNVELEEAQEMAHIGSWRWNLATNELVWSKEMYNIYGRDPKMGVKYGELTNTGHPDDHQKIQDAIQAALATKRPFAFEHRIIRPDKVMRFIQVRGEVVVGAGKKPTFLVGTAQDITDQKNAERELRKWADIFANARWGLVVGSPDGRRLEMMNPAFAKMMGYTVSELIGKDIEMLLPPEVREEHLRNVAQIRKTGHLVWETPGLRKDGTILPLQVDLTVVKDENQKPLYYVGSVRDMTIRKQAEEEIKKAHEELETRVKLRTQELAEANDLLAKELAQREETERALSQSNRKTAAILNSITDAYLHFDKQWRITDLNKPTEDILNRPAAALLKKNFWKEFPELKRESFFMGCQEAVTKNVPQHFECYFIFTDKWFEAHAYPSAEGLAVYLRDITERKLAEHRLRNKVVEIEQERAKDEALLDSIGEGIVAVDDEGKIMFMNRAAEIMFGCKANEVAGKVVSDVMPIVDGMGRVVPHVGRPLHAALITKKRATHNQFFIVRPNRTKFPVSITVSPILVDKQAVGAIAVYRDVTKEREIDKAKSEFVALASHQLRTPLTITSWYAEKLMKEGSGNTFDRARYLSELYRANSRMIDLVNALLDVSRIELGTLNIDSRPLDLRLVADGVIEELTIQSRAKKIKIIREYEEDLPKIKADEKLTKMIFQNIISNAIKYSGAGGVVKVGLSTNDDDLLITIADTGYGIPEAQQSKIFSKLFRADNAVEKEADGTGLGLYIVKSIIEQVGGSIRFESEENVGTTFFIALPLRGMRRKVDKDKLAR